MFKLHRLLLALAVVSSLLAGCSTPKEDGASLRIEADKANARLVAARESLVRVAAVASEVVNSPERYASPLFPGRRFATYDGAMVYSKEPDGKSSILGTGAVPVVGPVLARMRSLEHIEPSLQKEIRLNSDLSMAWFGNSESLGVFHPPYDMVALVPPRLDVTKDILPYRKAAEGNPTFGPVWLEPYIDMTGKGYVVTVSMPVVSKTIPGKVAGVAGIDVALEPLVNSFTGAAFADRMLVSSDSYLLAAGERISQSLGVESLGRIYYLRQVEKDVPAPEKFRLDRHPDSRVAALGRSLASVGREASLPWGDRVLHLKVEKLPETGWFMVEGTVR